MMDCCTAVFERALNEHLKAAPVPFAKVAHIFVTSHSLLSDYISGEVHDRLFQVQGFPACEQCLWLGPLL